MSDAQFRRRLRQAERALAKADPVLGDIIARSLPCGLEQKPFLPYESLLTSIAHQQLNGRAAQTIVARVKARLGDGRWPRPERLVRLRISSLRACGLSEAKARAFQDVARKTLDGTVPGARALRAMDDEAIVERLTQVRGIGRWSVEMMLMFRLGRLDVLPVDDFGVRKGFTLAWGHEELVKPKVLAAYGERWRPYRSVASWFLWRVVDGK
ncbi:MAG: DNA-3-methyladenine glycosylase 2 family protein [Myxococcota bacterium]